MISIYEVIYTQLMISMIVLLVLFSLSMTGCAGMAAAGDAYTYDVMKVSGDIDWDAIPEIPISEVLWTEDYGICATGQLCFDDEYLYVHQRAVEKEIRAENTEPLSPVYEDSCLEFFFKLDDSPNYFNFEINPNGCLGTGFGPKKTDRISITRGDEAEYYDIRTDRTADGWEVFYRIPLEYIQLFYPDYKFVGSLSANMYKCGNKTVHKHYLSWTPIDLATPNFHCPEYFGRINFK